MSQELITPIKEGFVQFRSYKTWYRIVGDKEEPGKLPLICLHGAAPVRPTITLARWEHSFPQAAG
jgi:hypothetical protein